MALRHNGIGGKIAVMFTALALLSANAPAPQSGLDNAQSSTPRPQSLKTR
ncbi:MAG: hypothetical protein J6575_07395 [Bifidobacterium sp.]|nr:hypothetical protein [Bifidobacterium sp.]